MKHFGVHTAKVYTRLIALCGEREHDPSNLVALYDLVECEACKRQIDVLWDESGALYYRAMHAIGLLTPLSQGAGYVHGALTHRDFIMRNLRKVQATEPDDDGVRSKEFYLVELALDVDSAMKWMVEIGKATMHAMSGD